MQEFSWFWANCAPIVQVPVQAHVPDNVQVPVQARVPDNVQVPVQAHVPDNVQFPVQARVPDNNVQVPVQAHVPDNVVHHQVKSKVRVLAMTNPQRSTSALVEQAMVDVLGEDSNLPIMSNLVRSTNYI